MIGILAGAGLSARALQGQDVRRASLAGIVRDTSGHPIALVLVTADSAPGTLTDSSGAFRIRELPVGLRRVSFRRIGFVPGAFDLALPPEGLNGVIVELVPAPVRLDTVTVAVPVRYRELEVSGFYDRLRQAREGAGVGRFITPEDLRALRVLPRTTHILDAGGVRMHASNFILWPVGRSNVILRGDRNRTVWGPCQMAVFIDGAEVDIGLYYDPAVAGSGLDAFVAPNELRAVEFYTSASSTPPQFQSTRNAQCGSVVIWTKRSADHPEP